MRRAIALLLLCSLSVPRAGRLGMVATWWLNRGAVARVLCIKPQLPCNDKCHLARQWRAAGAAEFKQKPLGGKQALEDIPLFCTRLSPARLTPPAGFHPAPPAYAALRVSRYAWPRPGPDYPPAEGC